MGFGGLSLWQLMIISCFILLYWLVRKTFKKSHKKETPQISDATFSSPQTPQAPETQEAPQAPETQEAPQAPQVPEVPEVPETPQSFAAPPNIPTTNPGDTGALKGWVYVATMDNTTGVVKIGYSERDPRRRIEEWSTGQPGDAHLAYAVLVEKPHNFERRVHKRLSKFRTRGEWFKCDLDTVITAIQESGTVLYAEDRRS